MIKRFVVILLVFIVIIAGLQIFGGRDFIQVGMAWDKYSMDEDLSNFASDIAIIFKGGKIKESAFPSSRSKEQILYRWKDQFGELHVSERKPNIEKFEEIKLGDMEFQIEEGMSQEEIDAVLKKDKK